MEIESFDQIQDELFDVSEFILNEAETKSVILLESTGQQYKYSQVANSKWTPIHYK